MLTELHFTSTIKALPRTDNSIIPESRVGRNQFLKNIGFKPETAGVRHLHSWLGIQIFLGANPA